MLYHGLSATVQGKKITYINTGIGQSMVADCVLAQSNKQIKKIIFLGAAGAISDFKINPVKTDFFNTGRSFITFQRNVGYSQENASFCS